MNSAMLTLIRNAWHAHALFWGKDETAQSEMRSCVVLAPHPDDESIGMGATIARKIAFGSKVVLVIATDGRYSQQSEEINQDKLIELRKAELIKAAEVLGLDNNDVYFFDEMDSKIEDERLFLKFKQFIDSLDFEVQEILSTSWNDSHQDHRACAVIAKQVANEKNIVFRGCPIYWWAQGPTRFHRGQDGVMKRQLGKLLDLYRAFFRRGFVVRSERFSEQRTRAIQAHASQISNLTGETEWTMLDPVWLKTFDRKKEFFVNN